MNDIERPLNEEPAAGAESDEWVFSRNPAMQALLDHVATELAAEFVRLMRASVAVEAGVEREGEKR